VTDHVSESGANTPPPLLTVEVVRQADASVVTPVGEVDMLTEPVLAEHIDEALAGSVRRIVVDLTRLTFFGSAGAACLVKAAEQARKNGSELRVVSGESVAARVLELSGLLSVLAGYDTLELALAD
jgi:anti-sigma B factor antagonist